MKAEKREIAEAVGKPVFDFIKRTNPDLAACDTETPLATCEGIRREDDPPGIAHALGVRAFDDLLEGAIDASEAAHA